MKIISIFDKNLFAIKYADETKDEFSRLFELWQDAEYLVEFFESHKSDLEGGFWGTISVENAILETFEYARNFENILLELSEQSEKEQIEGLENIFSPLHNSQYQILTLNKSKAKQTWLRLYALRIERCRRYLLDQGIVDTEGVIEEIES